MVISDGNSFGKKNSIEELLLFIEVKIYSSDDIFKLID
jgi:hypothetical protein